MIIRLTWCSSKSKCPASAACILSVPRKHSLLLSILRLSPNMRSRVSIQKLLTTCSNRSPLKISNSIRNLPKMRLPEPADAKDYTFYSRYRRLIKIFNADLLYAGSVIDDVLTGTKSENHPIWSRLYSIIRALYSKAIPCSVNTYVCLRKYSITRCATYDLGNCMMKSVIN